MSLVWFAKIIKIFASTIAPSLSIIVYLFL